MNRILAAAILATLTGCLSGPRIASPVPGVHEISLLPVVAGDFDETVLWTSALRDNLLRVEGVDRVVIAQRPVARQYDDREPNSGIADAAPTAASIRYEETADTLPILETSQALFEMNLLSFDVYYPPSASVEVRLFVPGVARARANDDDGMSLDRAGRVESTNRTVPARHRTSFMIPIRTDDPEIARAMRDYAALQMDDDRGYEPEDRILRSSERFIDFVAFHAVERAFARLAEVESTSEEKRASR